MSDAGNVDQDRWMCHVDRGCRDVDVDVDVDVDCGCGCGCSDVDLWIPGCGRVDC